MTNGGKLTVIGWRSVIVWAVVAMVVTGATIAGLWIAAASADTARAATQLEAIRTGLSVGVGAGGLFALWLATRRQRSTEVGLTQQERTIEATIADADEKRITELYTKAAEQIGHDKAPVRLAGVYALERLAQDNPRHRQTIVNVLCAYLRMPFSYSETTGTENVALLEEHEIRLTVQRILCAHLRPKLFSAAKSDEDQSRKPNPTFWPGIDINLDGAWLSNFDFRTCELGAANFSRAVFVGRASFRGATFTGEARFRNAVFRRAADFDNARFDDFAWFRSARFEQEARFGSVIFADTVGFKTAEFVGDAWFRDAVFRVSALFDRAVFHRKAAFGSAEFHDTAGFARAAFADTVELRGTTFHRGVWFRDVRFDGEVRAGHAHFHFGAFRRARFAADARFDHAVFHREAEFTHASFAREARFSATIFEHTANFDSAVFAGTARFTGAKFHGETSFEHIEFARTGLFQGARFHTPASRPTGDVDLSGSV